MTKLGTKALVAILLVVVGCGGGDANEPEGSGTSGGEDPDAAAEMAAAAEMEAAAEGGSDGSESTEGEAGDPESDSGEASAGADPEAGAEDPEEEWRRMLGVGRSVFRQACDTCHPGGGADLGPDIRRIGWSVEAMTRQIRRGSGRMRPITQSQLPEQYMDPLMAYLSRLGSVRGVERPE